MEKTKNLPDVNENQIAFDFLASVGREKVELDSPKYMENLNFDEDDIAFLRNKNMFMQRLACKCS